MYSVVHNGRYTAAIDGDFVVFLIGMRINRPWKPHKWLPVMVAMPRMLRWLDEHPEAGLLGWGTRLDQRPRGRAVLAQLRGPRPLRARPAASPT